MRRPWAAPSALLVTLAATIVAFLPAISDGCNVTLWTKVRFQHSGGAAQPVCFFHLPNNKWIRRDHLIEIAFSSFSMGRFVNHTCSGGHLKIVEDTGVAVLGGEFCGQTGHAHTYLTTSKSVTLHSLPGAKTDHFNAYFDVLSLDAVKRRYAEMRRASDGEPAPETLCDVVLHNCKSQCRITSPHYPSAYPRNVTCRYHVTFDRSDWQVVVGGQPGDRYDLAYHALCQDDHVKVWERTAAGELIEMATLCGRAKFPQMVARSNQVVVEFRSSASGLFHDGFRVTVGHQQRRKTAPAGGGGADGGGGGGSIVAPCRHQLVAGNASSQGHIYSARHWYPQGTDCAWTLVAGEKQRVWLEIRSKQPRKRVNAAQRQPTANVSSCDHQVHISDEDGTRPVKLMVCESNLTRTHFLLSQSRRMTVRFSSRAGSLDGADFNFDAFYMFVAADDADTRVAGSACDHSVRTQGRGSLLLLADRLLLRQRQLKCVYHLEAGVQQRLKIDIRTVKFDPIRQCDQGTTPLTECAFSDASRFDRLVVSDAQDALLCVCNSDASVATVYTASNVASIQLELSNIFNQAYKDVDIYQFRVDYSAVPNVCGRLINEGAGGHGSIQLDGPLHGEMCSWLIKMDAKEHVLFKINSLSIGDDCRSDHFVVRYLGAGSSRQERKFCSANSPAHLNNYGEFASPFAARYIYVELRSSAVETRFHLKWNVLVEAQSEQCQFRCPNSTWCLPTSLTCNGEINCPQSDLYGYLLDEDPAQCSGWNKPIGLDHHEWLLFVVLALIGVVFGSLCCVLCSLRRHRQAKTGHK